MTIFRALAVLFGISLIACGGGGGGTGGEGGGGGSDIDTLFPADDAIGSWVVDDVHGSVTNPEGVEMAKTNTELVDIINGGADPFTDRNFVQFGREYYTDGTYEAMLWIFEMPDAAVATDLYDHLFTLALYDYMNESVTAGDEARTGDSGLFWNFHVRKGKYFFLADNVTNDTAGRTAGEAFVAGVANGL